MYQYHCLNPISQIGLDKFTENYTKNRGCRGGRRNFGQKCIYA